MDTGIAGELDQLKSETAHEAEKENSAAESRREKLNDLRERIKNGESTGDRLRDFALVRLGDDLDGRAHKALIKLEERLAGKAKQLFVLAEYERVFSGGCVRDFRADENPEFRKPDWMLIGFLREERLALDQPKQSFGLPCSDFVVYKDGKKEYRTEFEAYFENDWSEFRLIGEIAGIGGWSPVLGENHQAPEMIVGDAEVIKWFSRKFAYFREEDARCQIARLTLKLSPSDHWTREAREEIRKDTLEKLASTESAIRAKRHEIEGKNRLMPIEVAERVEEIRKLISALKLQLDLALELGEDPRRSEILRITENFGHYWV